MPPTPLRDNLNDMAARTTRAAEKARIDAARRKADARGLVKPGGLAVIVSPYTWMEEHTPKATWLGGFKGPDGQPVFTDEALRAAFARADAADLGSLDEGQVQALVSKFNLEWDA